MKKLICSPGRRYFASIIGAKNVCNSDKNCLGINTDQNGAYHVCMNTSWIQHNKIGGAMIYLKKGDLKNWLNI